MACVVSSAALLQVSGPSGAIELGWDLVLASLAVLAIYLAFRSRADLAERMGFTPGDVALVTIGVVAGPVLNVPLAVVGGSVLGVNLGGALVPLLLVARLVHRGTITPGVLALGTLLVAAATRPVVDVEAGVGVVATFPDLLVPPAVALVYALVAARKRLVQAGPIAFGTGALGVLVGADLAHLPAILDVASQAPAGTTLVIGGGGALDLVVISGAVGLALALLLALATTPPPPTSLFAPGAPAKRVPDPDALVRQAQAFSRLTPREHCLVHLAHANQALSDQGPARAVQAAHDALDVILQAGRPRLLDQVRGGASPPELAGSLARIKRASQRATTTPPTWHEAAEVVEEAKHAVATLWPAADGHVRLEVTRP